MEQERGYYSVVGSRIWIGKHIDFCKGLLKDKGQTWRWIQVKEEGRNLGKSKQKINNNISKTEVYRCRFESRFASIMASPIASAIANFLANS
ncbi:hypothetical protein L6452_38029 [Arctium lappa]|uniref:Uncharacterized protein n=1 Tax=Arctium lappa TaxID=4217 RepID=A0ACB8Y4M2_ARCLA|nr:hypothetical protein L6452_38029 [Arctium lappa]